MSVAFRLPGSLESREAELALLWAYGCHGLWQDEDSVLAYFDAPKELPLAGCWEGADDTDYLARYYAELQPVRLSRLVVAPTHGPLQLEPGQKVLWLDPGMAFGTGHHETTRLALQALEQSELAGLELLDVGAGSGILSIAADLLGAASARGLDIDPDTVPVARANARLNLSRARFELGRLQDEAADSADVVLANLFAELHVLLAAEYRRVLRPGGTLYATGILAEKQKLVEAALAPHFQLLELRPGREWLLLAARAKEA